MVIAAIGLGELLWSLLVLFFMVVYLMMLFAVIADLFRDRQLGGGWKAVWALVLLVLPLLSVLAYLIARGDGMATRAIGEADDLEAQTQSYIRSVASSSSSSVDQIVRAKDLLDAGAIDESEFQRLKGAALGDPAGAR